MSEPQTLPLSELAQDALARARADYEARVQAVLQMEARGAGHPPEARFDFQRGAFVVPAPPTDSEA
ncbi:MAG TPA: hypothetical protein VFI96_08960 [Longimicrobiaceae bacterium]|nr:hypothetical protein [Longimicrobiaceae bacterium]